MQSKFEMEAEILEWRISGLPCKAEYRYRGQGIKKLSRILHKPEVLGCWWIALTVEAAHMYLWL